MLLRTIGYLGIALLVVFATFGMIIVFSNRDWYGVFMMTGFYAMLIFFWHGLRSSGRRESNPALRDASGLGWYGETFGAFFNGPILHTPEGMVLLFGTGISLLFAVLAWFVPSIVAINPARSSITTTLFSLWPIMLFTIYIKFCSPHFHPRVYTTLIMICSIGFPFYLVYK
jgi:hypothetical protein